MRAVWKFRVPISPEATYGWRTEVPAQARFLPIVKHQVDGEVWVWAEVNPAAPKRLVDFFIVGTGHPIPDETRYVGTFFMGEYVLHIYVSATLEAVYPG